MTAQLQHVLERLMEALTAAEVEAIIANDPVLKDEKNWRPVGGLKNNEGPIRHGADAGDALMERVTNSIDALTERERHERHKAEALPRSPREAAENWFGVPDGRIAFLPEKKRRQLAKRIQVIVEESGIDDAPTVSVRDTGIGQHPTNFAGTLLSINADNKVDRPYLMGAYGQGGAATYAFTLRTPGGSAGYSIVVSRRPQGLLDDGQQDLVGWTIIRYNPLSDDFKNGRFEYCTTGDGEIASVKPEDMASDFEPGTFLRFIQYDLQGYATVISAPRSSMWYLSNTVLFDPVLPFLIVDRREKYKTVKEAGGELDKVILGNANRLQATDEEEDEKDAVEHTLTHTVNLGDNGRLKVRYWVFKRRPPRASGQANLAIEAFSDTHSAVVFTFNGQRQGRESRTFVKNTLGMGILRNYLLVQVDCDELSKSAKKNIFSSTRDRMKQTSLYREILAEVGEILRSDPDLDRIKQRIHDASATALAEEDTKKIEQEFSKLVDQWEAAEEVAGPKKGKEEKPEKEDEPEKDDDVEDPVPPTPPEPLLDVPTKFEFMTKREPLRVSLGKRYNIRLALNAVPDYFTREKNRGEFNFLLSEGAPVQYRSVSSLKAGRMTVALLPRDGAKEGDEFTIGVSVSRPGQSALTISRKAILVKPKPKPIKKEKLRQIPNIQPVKEGEEMWNNLGWTTKDVAEVNAPPQGRPTIYISLSNDDYAKSIGRRSLSEEQISVYQRKYVTAIAFHAWLQHRDQVPEKEQDEATRRLELQRTVRTVIYTTFRGGDDA